MFTNHVKFLIIQIIMLLTVLSSCAKSDDQQEGGESEVKELHAKLDSLGISKIYGEAVNFEREFEGKNQRVTLIDMIHVAPKEFYQNIKIFLAELAQERGSYIVLREGVIDSREKKWELNLDKFDEFIASSLSTGSDWLNITSPTIDSWVEQGFLTHTVKDGSSNLMDTYNFFATIGFLEVQNEELFLPENTIVQDGDINVADLSIANQLMLDIFTSCMGSLSSRYKCATSGLTDSFEDVLDEFILKDRNQILIQKVTAQLAIYDTIVLPWGADHMPDLMEHLTSLGFLQKKITPIPLAACSNASYNITLRMIVYEYCQALDNLSNVLNNEASDIIYPLSAASNSPDIQRYKDRLVELLTTIIGDEKSIMFEGVDEHQRPCRVHMFSNWPLHLAVEISYQDQDSILSIHDYSNDEGLQKSQISHIKIEDNLIEYFDNAQDEKYSVEKDANGEIFKVSTELDSWIPFKTNRNSCTKQ